MVRINLVLTGRLPKAAAAGVCVAHIAYAVAISVNLKAIGSVHAVIQCISIAVIVRISLVLTDGQPGDPAAGCGVAYITAAVAISVSLKGIKSERAVVN
jgi:hypothetical protein